MRAILLLSLLPTIAFAGDSIVPKNAKLEKLWSDGEFTEGPAYVPDHCIYFTDPRYVGDEPREIDTESVYRIDPNGTVTQIINDVQKPNGIILSPDMATLYLADSPSAPKGKRLLLAYPLSDDGKVGKKKV